MNKTIKKIQKEAAKIKIHLFVFPMKLFGKINKIGVHQIYENEDDGYNALHNAARDGFNTIYLYTKMKGVDHE